MKKPAALTGIVLFLLISYVLPVPADLAASAAAAGSDGRTAMTVLGTLALAVCWWIGSVLPSWCTAVTAEILWITASGLSFSRVFAGFAGNSFWLNVGAFILMAAISKTGLLARISKKLIRLFPGTFRGQTVGLLSVGSFCAMLVPTATARAMLGAKLAMGTADLLGYEKKSREREGLFAAAWTGFGITATAFLTGSYLNYTMFSSLPEEYRGGIPWIRWLLMMIPWLLVMLAGMFGTIMLRYRPKGNETGKTAVRSAAGGTEEPEEKMSRQELLTAVLLAGSVLMWILEKKTGITSGVTAMTAALLCIGLGILDKNVVNTLDWGFFILIGSVLNIGTVLGAVGAGSWLASVLTPVFSITGNAAGLVILTVLAVVLVRTAMASMTATIVLMTSILAPIYMAVGIHPLVAGVVVTAASYCWFFLYQSPMYLAVVQTSDGAVQPEDTAYLSWFYELFSTLGLLACLPLWHMMGLL